MAENGAQRGGTPAWLGFVVLAVVAVVVFAGGAFFLFADDDDAPADATDPDATATYDAISDDEGAPTPLPNTGVIGEGRPDVGKPAPDFALVSARDESQIIKLSDFRGTPVILNWYASWCGPCKNEIPAFEAAYKEIGADSLTILGVNFLESQQKATGILDEFGATYPATLDTNGAISDQYRVVNMPTTYFIDADGNVVARHVGELTKEDLASELAELGIEWTPAS